MHNLEAKCYHQSHVPIYCLTNREVKLLTSTQEGHWQSLELVYRMQLLSIMLARDHNELNNEFWCCHNKYTNKIISLICYVNSAPQN